MSDSENDRVEIYKKNQSLETILAQMNASLAPTEDKLIELFNQPKLPVIFIVGAQRSGSTLLMQLLTQAFNFSYPSNFISRYWKAPYIGASLYASFSKNRKLNTPTFNSDLGYTEGLDGPHEFGYFWKQWFPEGKSAKASKKDLETLSKKLAAWESVSNSPLIFKNLLQVVGNIDTLQRLFPTAKFIHVTRELVYNTQSTYQSRIKLFNNENSWFGVKPSSYSEIKSLPVVPQIVRQIHDINTEICDQLATLDESRYISIKYENLTQHPEQWLNQIAVKFGLSTNQNSSPININLISGNKVKISQELFTMFETECKKFKTK